MSIARRKDLAMVAIGLLVIIVDQLTKRWIVSYFTAAPRPPVSILGDVLELQYLQNTGVAFSLLEGQTLKFLFIALAIAVIAYLYWQNHQHGSLLLKVSFGLVLGGAVGNLIDRFTRQYVVDFIHFQIPGHFDFAVFNIADSGITVGVILLAFLLWRQNLAARGIGQPTTTSAAARATASAQSSDEALTPDAAQPPQVRRGVTGGQ